MSSEVTVLHDATAVGAALAARLAEGIVRRGQAGERYVLGCPGGRSLRPTYRALAAELGARAPDAASVLVVMMDDYVLEQHGRLGPIPSSSHASCARFARQEIAAPLQDTGVVDVEVWLPDPQEPQRYDEAIAEVGGIDTFLLASGATDGHVAFNPPGTPRSARTRVVELAETTRTDNLQTFPDFGTIDAVPMLGVTVGPATIADTSRELVMVVTGADKHTAFRQLVSGGDYDPHWPATVVHGGPPAMIYADRAAAQDWSHRTRTLGR